MSLINLDNSMHIFGEAISVRLESDVWGLYHYIERETDSAKVFHYVLDLAPSDGKASDIRELGHLVNSILTHSRDLYTLQKMLNSREWRELRISASVEFRRDGDPWNKVLGVRTTWQDDPDRVYLS